MEKHKVAFIGPEFLHKSLQDFDPSWDLQVPVDSVQTFDDMIQSDDDEAESKISTNTKLIIVFSRLFDNDSIPNGLSNSKSSINLISLSGKIG